MQHSCMASSRREVTRRQKCALFFLSVAAEALAVRIACIRGSLDTSTTDAKTFRASTGLTSQGMHGTQKEGWDGHDFALDLSRSGGLA